MGNELSTEEQTMLEEAYKLEEMKLDSPDADKHLNEGTSAPLEGSYNERQKQQQQAIKRTKERSKPAFPEGEGVEVVTKPNLAKPEFHLPDDGSSAPLSQRHKRVPSNAQQRAAVEKSEEMRQQQARQREQSDEEKKMSYFQMAKVGYQELVNAFIRPPRAEYKVEALGPPAFTFCGRRFTRTDFALKTKRGLALQCSHWEPVDRTTDRIPVVIYMHGNSSARVEVIPQLSYLLSLGVAVFAFDFSGSGQSDGDFVSLGFYEREDLMCVIAHLRNTNVVSTIALWGRSMGAATALMHGDRDPSIACMILDSSFADLTQLAVEMVEKGREQGIVVPQFVVHVAIRMIRNSVKKIANFDIRQISPIAHADKCFIPALFVAGEHDDFINPHHSEQIHARYAGDKNMILVEGDHNSPRPKFMFDSVSIFLQTCLQIPQSWALSVHPGMNLMAPPWYYPQPKIFKGINIRNSKSKSRKSNGQRYTTEQKELGMTLERQREIQASLFKMLGQADTEVCAPPAPTKSNERPPTSSPTEQVKFSEQPFDKNARKIASTSSDIVEVSPSDMNLNIDKKKAAKSRASHPLATGIDEDVALENADDSKLESMLSVKSNDSSIWSSSIDGEDEDEDEDDTAATNKGKNTTSTQPSTIAEDSASSNNNID